MKYLELIERMMLSEFQLSWALTRTITYTFLFGTAYEKLNSLVVTKGLESSSTGKNCLGAV